MWNSLDSCVWVIISIYNSMYLSFEFYSSMFLSCSLWYICSAFNNIGIICNWKEHICYRNTIVNIKTLLLLCVLIYCHNFTFLYNFYIFYWFLLKHYFFLNFESYMIAVIEFVVYNSIMLCNVYVNASSNAHKYISL